MTVIYKDPLERLEIFLDEYQPQLEKHSKPFKLSKIPTQTPKNFPKLLPIFMSALPYLNLIQKEWLRRLINSPKIDLMTEK